MGAFNDLNIIIPTLDEAENIGELLNQIIKLYPGAHITVVDDGSKDGTQSIVQRTKGVKLIDRKLQKIKGLTVSVMDGIMDSKQPYFIVMDADFQHPLYQVVNIYHTIIEGNQIVIGTRNQVLSDWPLSRRIVSKSAIFLGTMRLLISGKYYKDVVSGFFGGYTAPIKETIIKHGDKFEMEGYKVLFDILKYIKEPTVDYVKYDFGSRGAGSSKMGKKQVLCYFRSLFK